MVASRRRRSFYVVAGVLGLLAIVRVASAAPGGDPAALAKVTNLNKKALQAYDKQDFGSARDLLKQALDLCAKAGLDQHPLTARTHIHFGAVAIVGFKQRELGLKHFRKAIEIEPDIKLTTSLVTPELQDAFDEAVLASNSSGSGDTAPPAGGAGDDTGDAGKGEAEGAEGAPSGDEDETAPRRPKPKPRKRHADDEDEDKDKGEEAAGSGQKGQLFFALTLGSGAGIASGSGEVYPAMHKLASAGFAVSQLGQVKPEVGYFMMPRLLLSLALRYQYINGLNGENNPGCPNGFCKPYSTATAVLAKGTWLFGDGPLRITAGGQIGGGYIRHAEVFNSDLHCSASKGGTLQGCVDTIAGGPFLIGPTAGVLYELGESFDLVGNLNAEVGISKFTLNLDIDVGVALRL
jgi:hypothetical protein